MDEQLVFNNFIDNDYGLSLQESGSDSDETGQLMNCLNQPPKTNEPADSDNCQKMGSITDEERNQIICAIEKLSDHLDFSIRIADVDIREGRALVHYYISNDGSTGSSHGILLSDVDVERDYKLLRAALKNIAPEADIQLIKLRKVPQFRSMAGLGSLLVHRDGSTNIRKRVGSITALLTDADMENSLKTFTNYALTTGHTLEMGDLCHMLADDHGTMTTGAVKEKIDDNDAAMENSSKTFSNHALTTGHTLEMGDLCHMLADDHGTMTTGAVKEKIDDNDAAMENSSKTFTNEMGDLCHMLADDHSTVTIGADKAKICQVLSRRRNPYHCQGHNGKDFKCVDADLIPLVTNTIDNVQLKQSIILADDHSTMTIGAVKEKINDNGKDLKYVDAALIPLETNAIGKLQLKQCFSINGVQQRLSPSTIETPKLGGVVIRAVDQAECDMYKGVITSTGLTILGPPRMYDLVKVAHCKKDGELGGTLPGEGESGLLVAYEATPEIRGCVKPVVMLIGMYPEFDEHGNELYKTSIGVDFGRVLESLSARVGRKLQPLQ